MNPDTIFEMPKRGCCTYFAVSYENTFTRNISDTASVINSTNAFDSNDTRFKMLIDSHLNKPRKNNEFSSIPQESSLLERNITSTTTKLETVFFKFPCLSWEHLTSWACIVLKVLFSPPSYSMQ